MELTRRLAEFIRDTRFEDVPPPVIDKGKHALLDWIGCAIGGIEDDASRIITGYVRENGGKRQATVIGARLQTGVVQAALANGVISHALDFDDYHAGTVIHGSASCLPAVLAQAESKGVNGRDFLTAFVLGFDVSIRIGLGLGSYHYEKGWHSTSTSGIFGAAAGTAKILGLNAEQITHAFGICGTQCSGLRSVFGTMSKPFNAGKSSMDGVMSTLLAKKGFTSARAMIEGELGLLDVLTEFPDKEAVIKDLGSKYHILDVSFKPYPTCA
jgi:2-methylcitrate dehydratase PrpD